MINYLKQHKEAIPSWLKNYEEGMNVTFDTIMDGRVGYYPGSGFDGNLVAVANKAHCVHSFLHVDYLVKKEELINMMDEDAFNGYHSIGRIEWTEQDIMPNGQYPVTINYKPRLDPMFYVDKSIEPYCFTEILERNADKDDEWGAERFAITFLLADGIATYFQLFVKQYVKAPWVFLLQNHGFGCNYDSFGKNGFLDAIIRESNIRPEFVICATNTPIWDGYRRVEDAKETRGGMHQNERALYKLNNNTARAES